jgi:hypothetical protein
MVTVPPPEGYEELAAKLASLADNLVTFQRSGASDEASQTINKLLNLIPPALASEDPSISELVVYILPLLPEDTARAIFDSLLKSGDDQKRLGALRVATCALEPEVAVDVIGKVHIDNFVDERYKELRTMAERRQKTLVGQPYFAFVSSPATKLKSITTVIHGTFAANQDWWQPGSSFMNGVASRVKDLYTDPDYFRWSGGNPDADRRRAAQDLLDWVGQHLEPTGTLRLICHSHGGNVAMIASKLGLNIVNLILLGTPIRTDYTPDMRNIEKVYNIYAPWDFIQSAGTLPLRRGEGRTLADTDVTLNIAERTGTGGRLKSHSALHDWNVWTHPDNQFDKYLS